MFLRLVSQASALLVLTLMVHTGAVHAAGREVGRVELPYSSGNKIVRIEDVSPDRSTKVANVGQQPWGVSLSLAVSGVQGAVSPAASWVTPNVNVQVDHVAATDASGHLILFYWSPDDQKDSARAARAAWKAVDVSEKTKRVLVKERPADWRVLTGKLLVEHIAGRDGNGDLYDFFWQPGKDWTAQQINSGSAPKVGGPLSAWTVSSGGKVEEFIAARSTSGQLVVFSRQGGTAWKHTIVAQKISAAPAGFDGLAAVAVEGANNHLLLFERLPSGKWVNSDLTASTSTKQTVQGSLAPWAIGQAKNVGARAPNGDLVVFREDPVEVLWSVENVSQLTGGKKIAVSPAYWSVPKSGSSMIHLAATDSSGRVMVFFRNPTGPAAQAWNVVDVTKKTGVKIHAQLTAWTTALGNGLIEHLAAPDQNGHLQVFNWRPDRDWEAVDVSRRSAGRVVASNATHSGVWISRDYGLTWEQSKRPQPAINETKIKDALPVTRVLDVAISPANPRVILAAADGEGRKSSLAGIYRSDDGGDKWTLVYTFKCNTRVEGVSQIVFAPDDPSLVYAAGGCGIARSTDGGEEWGKTSDDLLGPTGTPFDLVGGGRRVWHLAVSGQKGGNTQNRTIVACGDNSFWISRKGGAKGSWILDQGTGNLPNWRGTCTKTSNGDRRGEGRAQRLALDPTDSDKVYYAHLSHANGPTYYRSSVPDGTLCNIPIVIDADGDGKYDTGEQIVRPDFHRDVSVGDALIYKKNLKYFDRNGNNKLDAGTSPATWGAGNDSIVFDANGDGKYDSGDLVVRGVKITQSGSPTLEEDKNIKYRKITNGYEAYSKIPYAYRGCGQGSLWFGDLTNLTSKTGKGSWTQLPGPPVFEAHYTLTSGHVFVATHQTTTGHLVFFGDTDTVNVSVGKPVAGGWYRVDGHTPSEATKADIFMHSDPEAVAVSPDLELTLKTGTLKDVYSFNAEFGSCKGGRIWISNHGGVYSNDDCAELVEKKKHWHKTLSGLNTAWAVNMVGATGRASDMTTSALPLARRALYFGSTHDDDFFSMDDGVTWKDAAWGCGDCDAWYGNLYQRNRVLKLDPRADRYTFFINTKDAPPDGGSPTAYKYPAGAKAYAINNKAIRGYRPVIQTLPGKTPPTNGDYIVIRDKDGKRELLRAYNSLNSAATDTGFTVVPSSSAQPFPSSASWVQASGGHANPTYFAGGVGSNIWLVWRGRYNTANQVEWKEIVRTAPRVLPGGSVAVGNRFFVSPWDPDLIYLIDVPGQAVRVSTDGGDTWKKDDGLRKAVTANGEWPFVCEDDKCLLNDMAFDPTNSARRFAAGLAGVFFTADGGVKWHRLLDTRALPSRPRGLWFDPITDPNDDALFVANLGRGILRLHPIPDQAPQTTTTVSLAEPPSIKDQPWQWETIPGKIRDGGFETGEDWASAGDVLETRTRVRGGGRGIALGGVDHSGGQIEQDIEVPCGEENLRLSFWWYMTTREGSEGGDILSVHLEKGGASKVLETLVSIRSEREVWVRSSSDISSLGCGDMKLYFSALMNGKRPTTFYIDDVTIERGTRTPQPQPEQEPGACPPGQYMPVEGRCCRESEIWDGRACTCPEGEIWDTEIDACNQIPVPDRMPPRAEPKPLPPVHPKAEEEPRGCPPGQHWDGRRCVCPEELRWNGEACERREAGCPPGQHWDGRRCVCPEGLRWNGEACEPREAGCPPGQHWDGERCVCPEGLHWNGESCEPREAGCPPGQHWDGERCVCPEGLRWNGQTCEPVEGVSDRMKHLIE